MGIAESIGQFFRAIAEMFGYKSKKLDLKNQAPVVQSKVAKQTQAQKNEVSDIVEKGDIEKVREKFSE